MLYPAGTVCGGILGALDASAACVLGAEAGKTAVPKIAAPDASRSRRDLFCRRPEELVI